MNPLLLGYSGATPEPTRNALSNNQGTNEDDSQNDPHPEAGLFHGQTTRNTGPEDGHDRYFCRTCFFVFSLNQFCVIVEVKCRSAAAPLVMILFGKSDLIAMCNLCISKIMLNFLCTTF